MKRDTLDGKLREVRTERSESHVLRLPVADATWTIDADIGEKARGIYKARLYGAKLAVQGSIDVPARARFEDGTSRYKWHTARLVLGISDPHGIRAASGMSLGGASYAFAPGSGDAAMAGGLHASLGDLDLSKSQRLDFSLIFEIAGSEALSIAPLGADTAVSMRANWPHPSFQGRFLPVRHEIGADGFSASWKVSRFAAQGAAQAPSCAFPCNRMSEQLSVSLIEPVGLYQQLERASKYGYLFIGLTVARFPADRTAAPPRHPSGAVHARRPRACDVLPPAHRAFGARRLRRRLRGCHGRVRRRNHGLPHARAA